MRGIDICHGCGVEHPLGFACPDEVPHCLTVLDPQIARCAANIPSPILGLDQEIRTQLAICSKQGDARQTLTLHLVVRPD